MKYRRVMAVLAAVGLWLGAGLGLWLGPVPDADARTIATARGPKAYSVASGVTNSAQLSDVTGNITLTATEVTDTLISADTSGDKIFELPTPAAGYRTVITIAYSGVTVQLTSGTTCYVNGVATAGATGAKITTGVIGEYFNCWTIWDAAASSFRWAIRKQDD